MAAVRGGTPLNRTIGAVNFLLMPQLNVSARQLGKGGITLSLDEELVTVHDQLVGTKNSPKATVRATLTLDIVKDVGVSSAWQAQYLLYSDVGDCMVYPDTKALLPTLFENGAITKIESMPFNGEEATIKIVLSGFVAVNSLIWTGI